MNLNTRDTYKRLEDLERILKIARMVVLSLPRSAQLTRLVSKLKEKIEDLDEE